MMIEVKLEKGTVSQTALNSIAGMFHRDKSLQTLDQSDGLSFRPIYKNKKTGAVFSFTTSKRVLFEGRKVEIKKWKIGNFYQKSQNNLKSVANFKSPFEKDFISTFVDLERFLQIF